MPANDRASPQGRTIFVCRKGANILQFFRKGIAEEGESMVYWI